jgi:hypothetical protein
MADCDLSTADGRIWMCSVCGRRVALPHPVDQPPRRLCGPPSPIELAALAAPPQTVLERLEADALIDLTRPSPMYRRTPEEIRAIVRQIDPATIPPCPERGQWVRSLSRRSHWIAAWGSPPEGEEIVVRVR